MRTLIVEDDFVSSTLLKEILTTYGEADIAVDGREAINLFKKAIKEGNRYNLICLDIMIPQMDGQEVLIEVREIEKDAGIWGSDGARIIMTTALGDFENIKQAFREQCEAYLVKPIDRDKLFDVLKELELF